MNPYPGAAIYIDEDLLIQEQGKLFGGRNEDATYRIYYDAAPSTAPHPGPTTNSNFALYNVHGMLKLDMRSTAGVCRRVQHQETWRQPPARRRLAAQQLCQLPAGVTAHVALWDTVQQMNYV